MSQPLELELDTTTELLLRAMARLGWAGCLVLGAIWWARPETPLGAPLALTVFLALSLSLLARALSELYLLDLDNRKLLYVSRLFSHRSERSYSFDEIAAASLLATASRGCELQAPCLITRGGQVLRVGDFDPGGTAARVRALQLAEQIGCPFQEPAGQPQPALGERVHLAWSLALVAWFAMIVLLTLRSGN